MPEINPLGEKSHRQDTPDMLKVKATITDLSKRYNQCVADHGQLDYRTVKIKVLLAEAHYELAEFEFQQGHCLDAVYHYHFSFHLSGHYRSGNVLYEDKNQQARFFSSSGRLLDESSEVSEVSDESKESEVIFLQGLCYLSGIGVRPNDQMAFSLFKQAADQENAEAQYNLGNMYYKRRVAGVSPEEADTLGVQWTKRAAEQGNAAAQNHLAYMYAVGRVAGVSQEEAGKKALLWYQKAAEQGNAAALQTDLGCTCMELPHEFGDAFDEQLVLWFEKVAAQGNPIAQINLGYMYKEGRVAGVSQEEAGEQALLIWEKAVEGGDAMAQCHLGHIYYIEGEVGDKQAAEYADKKAVSLFEKAAEQGNPIGRCQLGCMYMEGRVAGVSEDADKHAVLWFQMAAAQGNPIAQINLGYMYTKGRVAGVSQEDADKLAVMWCQKAAEQGNAMAQNHLGYMYEEGRAANISQEDVSLQALLWWKKAVEQGKPIMQYTNRVLLESMARSTEASRNKGKLVAEYALFHLHLMYVKPNAQEAMKWFNQHPREHLITCCHELIALLLNAKTSIDEQAIQRHIDFVNQYSLEKENLFERDLGPIGNVCFMGFMGYVRMILTYMWELMIMPMPAIMKLRMLLSWVVPVFVFFGRKGPSELDNQLHYALQRVPVYLNIFQGARSESPLEDLQKLQKSEYFTGEDAFHLAMHYFGKKTKEHDILGEKMMAFAAKKGGELANDWSEGKERLLEGKERFMPAQNSR